MHQTSITALVCAIGAGITAAAGTSLELHILHITVHSGVITQLIFRCRVYR
ncbi:uncharacterized protein PHALS_14071 [Plasmopara halstedii]|uniref:Uncharacterized protein n=1 Tax=Plasmopara halstedii TaxID=4781 RepID=A0A0N7L6B1_PLAHL|nr:uncharacterized protein PHALS_14071 [Plasmopara halstedii]CEG43779.1 hypothetical protein PHALS_14071 [Plasmopara halstedii]|eukprot:XP_024580148.1 hypothetical protein PHALS_14071 [Plasmopara halstedii]